MCGNIDDCGLDACRNGNRVDEVNGYMRDCDGDHELMLLVERSVCVAKDLKIFSRTWFSGTDVSLNVKVRRCCDSSEKMTSRSARVPIKGVRCHRCCSSRPNFTRGVLSRGGCWEIANLQDSFTSHMTTQSTRNHAMQELALW